MFDSRGNFRSLIDDPMLSEKIASARELVAAVVPAAPRTSDELQTDVGIVTKEASQVRAEIAAHLDQVQAERNVKVACVRHIAVVCGRLLKAG